MRNSVKVQANIKRAATIERKKLAARPSIAKLAQLAPNGEVMLADTDGLTFNCPNIDAFNMLVERLGYKPVRVSYNMLNKAAGEWLIDADTPSYCDPACESYHSM